MEEYLTRIQPTPDADLITGWWDGYLDSVTDSSMSPTALAVLEADCDYIHRFGVLGAGAAGSGRWPVDRVRRGVVMGAVQSGKTASMLGVAAKSLDSGVNIVLILAGTRVALWRQTYERLLDQLDRQVGSGASQAARRLLVPDPHAVSASELVRLRDLYSIGRSHVRRCLRDERPIVIVVMKNVHHLRAVSSAVRECLVPSIDKLGLPAHMLVLDDEADDGSILDARIERQLDPATQDLKQIPRAIVDLWDRRPHGGTTTSKNLHVTYIGYTATPQANFLQSEHNPLAPRDFAIGLRTPFDSGVVEPRSTTYAEPKGLNAYYTGGEAFYRRMPQALCSTISGDEDEDLAESTRAFLVAGAIRLWRRNERLLPSQVAGRHFSSASEAVSLCPEPHSMLIHPSAEVADHFETAGRLLTAVAGLEPRIAVERIRSGDRSLPTEEILGSIERDEASWSVWLERYRESASLLQEVFDLLAPRAVPERWEEVRSLLIDEVIPHTKIAIVNSDPESDDRPRFAPLVLPDGAWAAPKDLSTIFISGNVMSRGLTLEGLTTTLFLRSSNDPHADTQMQMQRWFGYRGSYLDLCRVFVSAGQLRLFRAYHEADEALRRDVVTAMNELSDRAPSPKVVQGPDFTATGKLTNVANVPLCPGSKPFIRLINSGEHPDPNVAVVGNVFAADSSRDLVVAGTARGRILDEPLSLVETANLLDSLRYERHSPGPGGWEGWRWRALEAHVGISEGDDERLFPLFRPPGDSEGEGENHPRIDCPYAMAAYLRLWEACLTRHARGLYATDHQDLPWSMLDLRARRRQAPRFYVGIRYGSGSEVSLGVAGVEFTPRAMRREVENDLLRATWGSRNPSGDEAAYLGDELFDYHHHSGAPRPPMGLDGSSWRPAGAPGLVLFHIVERDERPHPAVAVGLAIPLGGPDQFAARSGG